MPKWEPLWTSLKEEMCLVFIASFGGLGRVAGNQRSPSALEINVFRRRNFKVMP